MNERDVVRIGNSRGRIALYLDETEAIDLAYHYGHGDTFFREMLEAVEEAYPDPADERRPGIRIVLRPDEHGRLRPGFLVT